MVDLQTVCSMCGDVGFPDKLFRCSKCHSRFQHSYCSNYYAESSEPMEQCDWCRSDQQRISSPRLASNSSPRKYVRAAAGNNTGVATNKSEYSGDKIKQHHDNRVESASVDKGKNPGGAPSPRIRRYKLLKDVMC